MALEVTVPQSTIILPEHQSKISFKSVSIVKDEESGLCAYVVFKKTGADGTVTDSVITYKGKEYNQFWYGFTTGTFLYSQLSGALGFPVQASQDLEGDFINPPTKE